MKYILLLLFSLSLCFNNTQIYRYLYVCLSMFNIFAWVRWPYVVLFLVLDSFSFPPLNFL